MANSLLGIGTTPAGIGINLGPVGIDIGSGGGSGSGAGLIVASDATLADDPSGLLSGLTMLDLAGINLGLLGTELLGTGINLNGSTLTLPAGLSLGGVRGTDGADILNLSANTVLGNAVLGAGDDTVSGPVSSVVNGIIDAGSGNDHITVGTGNATLNGGDGDDTLTALGSGNNTLDGGTGTDTMNGGLGDDTYYVDNAGDRVIEASGQGTDTVISSVDYALSGIYVENLTLTGGAVSAIGNSLANALTGNAADNVLNGGGAADAMAGGLGNDTYFVDDAGDRVTEVDNAGIDTVKSTIGYTLGHAVENLSLLGTADVGATGNELANVITGNAGANRIDGGAGADTMLGGKGDDTYVVDNAADTIRENSSGGHDIVLSSVGYTLPGGLEDLVLTGIDALNGIGSRYDNVITGNGASNTLSGLAGVDTLIGGAGDDVLVGGASQDFLTGDSGADRFVFATGDFGGRVQVTADRITDFSSADGDKIDLRGVDGDLTQSGFQHLAFVGSGAFTGAGQFREYVSGGNTYLEFNFDSQLGEDDKIKIDGVHTLTTADLLI